MALTRLEREGDVFVLRLVAGENRFNPDLVDELNAAIDEVERTASAKALVTVGEDKFYSNGFDLVWMGGAGPEGAVGLVTESVRIVGRLLTLGVPTIAAINGHAFGMGAFFAIGHDWRLMRADRGYFCLPEADLSLPLPAGTPEILRTRLTPADARHLVLTGARVGAEEAHRRGIVDEVASLDELLPKALARAEACGGKDRANYAVLKRSLYREAVEAIEATG